MRVFYIVSQKKVPLFLCPYVSQIIMKFAKFWKTKLVVYHRRLCIFYEKYRKLLQQTEYEALPFLPRDAL